MEWDLIFPFPSFSVKQVLHRGGESCHSLHVIMERKACSPRLCYKCGSTLGPPRRYQETRTEDLQMAEFKVYLKYKRAVGKCTNCKKFRIEAVEYMCPQNAKMTKRLSLFLFKLSEIAPISRLAEITAHNKMSLWRNDLKLLQHQFENYEIPEVKRLSVDEVYARSYHDEESENRNDRFFTIVTDLDSHQVIWVADSRSKKALDEFFERLGPEKCMKVEAVATDDHDDYAVSIQQHCPNAIRILDRFHLMRHFEEAINDTRKMLYKMLPQKSVRDLARPKYRFIFLKKSEKRTAEEANHMAQVMKDNEAFFRLEVIKERMITFFDAEHEEDAYQRFIEIETWAKESGFTPVQKFCRKLRRKWSDLMNYFHCKITTGVSEGKNTAIKALKRRAYGFRNSEYFKLKILQVCGVFSSKIMGLDGQWTKKGRKLFGLEPSCN